MDSEDYNLNVYNVWTWEIMTRMRRRVGWEYSTVTVTPSILV